MMFDSLSNKQMINLISKSIVGRLGCHADGKTYVVPISYAYHDGYIYFRTFEGMKITMMRKNPDVCFQVDKMDDMADWQSVIVWGTFEEITDPTKRKNALEILLSRMLPKVATEMVKFTSEWPFPPSNDLDKIEGIVFRIRIEEMTGRSEKLDPGFYRK